MPAFWLDASAAPGRLLAPLSCLYCGLVKLRRAAYRRGLATTRRLPVPVIVVGNIFVGGTGKTPLVAWVVAQLLAHGRRPGILVRGYGGRGRQWPVRVESESDPARVGDEAVLLARRTGVPVAAGPDRIAAAGLLIEAGCDVLVSDDGLQHYRLARDLELVVLDAARKLGNGRCLPAGPLREPPARLAEVDLVIGNGGAVDPYPDYFQLRPDALVRVDGEPSIAGDWRGKKVHAVAGIGNPGRFFDALSAQGLRVIPHAFGDHHAFEPGDLAFGDELPVVMTEKDAVKVRAFARPHYWYQPVTAQPGGETEKRLQVLLARCLGEAGT